jgi:broad specificity phosphatase PhoE
MLSSSTYSGLNVFHQFLDSMAPIFLFVRHGQADHNVGAEQYGDAAYEDPKYRDAPLTELGQHQAFAAGKTIQTVQNRRQVHIYSSPLTRCIQTAEGILSAGVQASSFILHDSLLERLHHNHPCNARKTPVEIRSQFPRWDTHFLPLYPPLFASHSEPYDSVSLRMNAFFEYLQKKYEGTYTMVIVVSHHDAIESLLHLKLANGQVVKYV